MTRKRVTPATYVWAFWTTARASAEYVAGLIGADEWHTRVGIARLAVGREEPDLPGPRDTPAA
jgi:hypothetical protein